MHLYDKPHQLLAVGLAAVAGYADALAYLHFGGYFASFMSGNSTRLALGLAADRAGALTAATLIVAFVAGVMLGSMVADRAGSRRVPAVLGLVLGLMLGAAGLAHAGWRPAPFPMVIAMGAMNAVFRRNGDISIGLTYVTGTLVKLGQRLFAALAGRGDRFAWLPYGLLWSGLVGGAYAGAVAYAALGLEALWLLVAVIGAILGVSVATGWGGEALADGEL